MEAVMTWLLTQGWPGIVIIGLAYLWYNERKERMEMTRLYMKLQFDIMELLSDVKKSDSDKED